LVPGSDRLWRALPPNVPPFNYLCGREEEGRSQQRRWFWRAASLPEPGRPKLLTVLPYDRGRRFEEGAAAALIVDKRALGGNSSDDILGGQISVPCRRHLDVHGCKKYSVWCLNFSRPQACNFRRVIPEIDFWRAANLMLRRYDEKALEESVTRADELAAASDDNGAATWRRITTAVGTDRTGPVTTLQPLPYDSAVYS
jgi:hypothetical protein